jgi:hypothetical protein
VGFRLIIHVLQFICNYMSAVPIPKCAERLNFLPKIDPPIIRLRTPNAEYANQGCVKYRRESFVVVTGGASSCVGDLEGTSVTPRSPVSAQGTCQDLLEGSSGSNPHCRQCCRC